MITNYLKEYFKKNKVTQNEIVERTGISQSKISLVMNNKRKLTAEELVKIATTFDLDLNKLKDIKSTMQK